MIIATAGHVDHGKTSLIKALTGVDADRLPEEKKRGLTIDLGFVYDTEISPKTVIGFVDVPGHERFIANMLAGVTAIGAALLVVAADDGPMPQTREHLDILDLVGVKAGFVALTKVDRVDAGRIAEVTAEITALLDGTGLAGAPIFPVSATDGSGVDAIARHLKELAEAQELAPPRGNFRMAVDRAFTIAGAGLVVTGLVQAGTIRVGDAIILSPGGRDIRVRALRAQNQTVEQALEGERCAINLAGRVRKEDIRRGDWIVAQRAHVQTHRLDALIRVLGSEDHPLKHWTSAHVHLGTADVTGRIAILESKEISVGNTGLVQLVLNTQVNASAGDAVIIRDQSARRTIGGGWIVDPFSPARGRARPKRLSWVKALCVPDRSQALDEILRNAPAGAPLHTLEAAWNLTETEAQKLRNAADVCCVGDGEVFGLSLAHWNELAASILSALEVWHHDKPDAGGANGVALMRALPQRCPRAVFEHVVAGLIERGEIIRAGAVLQRRGYEIKLTDPDEKQWHRVRSIMDAAENRPPTIWEISEALGVDQNQIGRLLARVAKVGLIARVSANRYITIEMLRALAGIAEKGARNLSSGKFSVAAYRDWSGMGRNLSIEILEFFDKLKFTRRVGNEREILKPAAGVFVAEIENPHQSDAETPRTIS